MNSVRNIMSKMLRGGSAVTALVGTRIYTGRIPQEVAGNSIAVYLVSQQEEELLAGATYWPDARVSVECRASNSQEADKIAEAVIDWLRDKDRYDVVLSDGTYEASFRKEGSDETDDSEETQQGLPVASRRIVDFYIRYRRIS